MSYVTLSLLTAGTVKTAAMPGTPYRFHARLTLNSEVRGSAFLSYSYRTIRRNIPDSVSCFTWGQSIRALTGKFSATTVLRARL
jgi:hypothetical protein